MCIFCTIYKWCRRVGTMLPWLIVPYVGLWGVSNIMPPAFRFEITFSRLAFVLMLSLTLFWYEVASPRLSSWKAGLIVRLRRRKKLEALVLRKLRRAAKRRCRNCLNLYKEQIPYNGRLMCSYCGHVSKRPVIDFDGEILPNVAVKEFIQKSEIMLEKGGWVNKQEQFHNGNRVGGPISWMKNQNCLCGRYKLPLVEKCYSSLIVFIRRCLRDILFCIRWLWRFFFKFRRDESTSDVANRGKTKVGEKRVNLNETKGERARRKAEEKRQARLEKEVLEQEERKQREEVARLVEEQRKLRDEKEAQKDCSASPTEKENDKKKEAEKKRQEIKKEKDKGSSKSNSYIEEFEKGAVKEIKRKHIFHKKNDITVDGKPQRESAKGESMEARGSADNKGRGNAANKYLDRMKGTICSSSATFSNGGLFGKGANLPARINKANKSNSSVDHSVISIYRRDCQPQEQVANKPFANEDDKNISHPVTNATQHRTEPKMSGQQLFIHSSPVSTSSNANVGRLTKDPQTVLQTPKLRYQSSPTETANNPIDIGLPFRSYDSKFVKGSTSSSLGLSPAIESIFSSSSEVSYGYIPEEPELFEDTCYEPISSRGPVSESLCNSQWDLGTSFAKGLGLERSHAHKNKSTSSEVRKPSPIESPLSRLRVSDDKQNNSHCFPSYFSGRDTQSSPLGDVYAKDEGTWQMWSSSPLIPDVLGLISDPASWLLQPEHSKLENDKLLHRSPTGTMTPLFTNDDLVLSSVRSPTKVFTGSAQQSGTFGPIGSLSNDIRQVNAFLTPSGNDFFSYKLQEECTQNRMIYQSPCVTGSNHTSELSAANRLSRDEVPAHISAIDSVTQLIPLMSSYSESDLQSVRLIGSKIGKRSMLGGEC